MSCATSVADREGVQGEGSALPGQRTPRPSVARVADMERSGMSARVHARAETDRLSALIRHCLSAVRPGTCAQARVPGRGARRDVSRDVRGGVTAAPHRATGGGGDGCS